MSSHITGFSKKLKINPHVPILSPISIIVSCLEPGLGIEKVV